MQAHILGSETYSLIKLKIIVADQIETGEKPNEKESVQ